MIAQKENPAGCGPDGAEKGNPRGMPTNTGNPVIAASDAVVKREFVPLAAIRRTMQSDPPADGLTPGVLVEWRDAADEQRRLMGQPCACYRSAPCPTCCAWDAALRRIEHTRAQIGMAAA